MTKITPTHTPMLILLMVIVVAIIGGDCFLCFGMCKHWPWLAKVAIWLPSAMLCVCMFYMTKGNWGWPVTLLIFLLLCIVIPKLIFCIFAALGKLGGLKYSPIETWGVIIGAAIAIIVSLCSLYGCAFGWKRSVTNEITLTSQSLPCAFDGYRIVQITDLHLGTFGSDIVYIQDLVQKINTLHPDLIVFTGDLVNFTYHEALPFTHELGKLQAKDGVLSILGNHDYALYAHKDNAEMSQRLVDKLVQTERSMGWRMLLDENVPITRGNDTIWVAGVQNIGRHFSANKGDLTKALSGIPQGAFTILLSHDPTHWEDAVLEKTNIPITLSGHTHAMQMKIFGWSPSSWIFSRWGGHHQVGDQHLYVSTGAGGNLPFRFGAWPEIAVLQLERAKNLNDQ